MSMQALESWFPSRFCLNLARRPDRWEKVQQQFARQGLTVERFEAWDGSLTTVPSSWKYSAGAYACRRSHLDIIRKARDRSDSAVLVFEDDVEFPDDFGSRLPNFLAAAPPDWDGLWLGALHRWEPTPFKGEVSRLVESDSTFAFGLRSTVFDRFIDLSEQTLEPVDLITKRLQKEFAFYCATPPLSWVSPDVSDVQSTSAYCWWIRDGIAVDGAKSEELRARTAIVILPAEPAEPIEITSFLLKHYESLFKGKLTHSLTKLPDHCEYVAVTQSNLYVRPWDVKAALLKCAAENKAFSSSVALNLSSEDSRMVIDGSLRTVDTRKYLEDSTSSERLFLVAPCSQLLARNTSSLPIQSLRLSMLRGN